MSNLPPCGIYRTKKALPGKEEWVKENLLVYFHNHSQQGPPLLLLPAENAQNHWSFHDKGYLVRDLAWVEELEPILPEGYYVLKDALYLSQDEKIQENTLVQLGYNRAAEPILFLGEFEEGGITFPSSGLKCTLEIFDLLDEVGFRVPNFNNMH